MGRKERASRAREAERAKRAADRKEQDRRAREAAERTRQTPKPAAPRPSHKRPESSWTVKGVSDFYGNYLKEEGKGKYTESQGGSWRFGSNNSNYEEYLKDDEIERKEWTCA